jgi:hypothetical protein
MMVSLCVLELGVGVVSNKNKGLRKEERRKEAARWETEGARYRGRERGEHTHRRD